MTERRWKIGRAFVTTAFLAQALMVLAGLLDRTPIGCRGDCLFTLGGLATVLLTPLALLLTAVACFLALRSGRVATDGRRAALLRLTGIALVLLPVAVVLAN